MSVESETFAFAPETVLMLEHIKNASGTRDSFLCELLRWSSYSTMKFFYLGHAHPPAFDTGRDLYIEITPNKNDNTLTIMDTGIGMTKADLVNNLVFYVAFMVADKVVVTTKNNDDDCFEWESNGEGSFIVKNINEPEFARGTRITMHLKEDQIEYLEEGHLLDIIGMFVPKFSFTIRIGSMEIEANDAPALPTRIEAIAMYIAYQLDEAESQGIEEYIACENRLRNLFT